MSGDPGFDTDWLDCRFPYDSAARNIRVENAALGLLGGRPVIADLGAGNGSNFRHFVAKIPHATWICVEKDPALVTCLEHMGGMQVVQASLLELSDHVDLGKIDLVMANAVLDLFSEEQVFDLLRLLSSSRIPFLATMNYTGMEFLPALPLDSQVVAWYDTHMKRPQYFGNALGPSAPLAIMQQVAGNCVHGESVWELNSSDRSIQGYLLGFMSGSVPELDLSPGELEAFDQWLKSRIVQWEAGLLKMRVYHQDILILPE